ncbi:hypothetical protein EIN_372720 [Entamoeba invadens IP1]|uniref:Tyrosine-protein kinase ephrin type A/B receptor-like domain-containing protein n=1 Tax=Entamoeba invadens IP1 TaxID=370355 RepID=A0A0A1TU10_ENTIV|nr:hypothetical protein EIN_372720 [Entamoeba invadens IP1]ELP83377.1 hypothetical protein EIN_372720 [Entamoeba invadens IP1]|eukprot:XP_004182723.1 hypothetical protein EIN_372720 [Entamoeba invadens IP1]
MLLLLLTSLTLSSGNEGGCFSTEYYDSANKICIPCEAGQEPNEEKTGCINCKAGSYSTNTSRCLPCVAGTYSDSDGADECLQCKANKYSVTENSVKCDSCEAPMIPNPSHTGCVFCADGTRYVGFDKVLPCEFCGKNSISSDNNTSCEQCDKKHMASNNICLPFCKESTTEDCFNSTCEVNEQYIQNDCTDCDVGYKCDYGEMTQCGKKEVCVNGVIKETCNGLEELTDDKQVCY